MPHRRNGFLISVACTALLMCSPASAATGAYRLGKTSEHSQIALARWYMKDTRRQQQYTAEWKAQYLHFVKPTRRLQHVQDHSLAYWRMWDRVWKRRHKAAQAIAQHPPHKAQVLCIHNFEENKAPSNGPTGWATNTGNNYFGGVQMDRTFMATYGGGLLLIRGTADHWSALQQIWAAERAIRIRGFWPWPNTARDCGLLP